VEANLLTASSSILFETPPLKARKDMICWTFGGMPPSGYDYGLEHLAQCLECFTDKSRIK